MLCDIIKQMKVSITIFLLCLFRFCFAHENVVVKHQYENVEIFSSTCFYTEEINRNLIIGQYVQLLSDKKDFKKRIKIIILQDFVENILINANKNTDDGFDLQVTIVSMNISVPETVFLISHIIDNYNTIPKRKSKQFTWRDASENSIANDILKTKIYRPNIVKELEFKSDFTYYFQNDSFFVEKNQDCNTQVLSQVKDLKQFNPVNNNILVIIYEKNNCEIISSICEYDFNEKVYKPKNFTDNFKILEDEYTCFHPFNIQNLSYQIFFESIDQKQLHSYSITEKKFIQNINEKIK